MGLYHRIRKDKRVRNFVLKNELPLIVNKYFWYSNELEYQKKLYYWYKYINKYHLNSSSSRIVNYCILTGRAHWILRRFRCSRMTFKNLADYGMLHGVRKASF